MYLLSYIRGDFVYCPVLLVLFTIRGVFYYVLCFLEDLYDLADVEGVEIAVGVVKFYERLINEVFFL